MTAKWVIIGCGSLAAVFIIVVAVAMYFALRSTSGFMSEMASATREPKIPADLKKPRVLVGAGLLASKPVYKHSRLGNISSIVRGKLDGGSSDEIGVSAPGGAAILNKDFVEKSYMSFFTPSRWVDIVDVEGDGVCEYLNKGGYGSYASLIGHDGKTLCNFGDIGVDDTAYGDVDGDGKLEFAVAAGNGLRNALSLLDSKGRKRWSVPDMYFSRVVMADVDGDGRPEVVYNDSYGNVAVLNAAGKLVSRERPEVDFGRALSLIPWPTRADRKYLFVPSKGKFWILGFDANTVATIDAPNLSDESWDALAVYAKLKRDKPDYLAVLVNYDSWDRSVLYIYDQKKNLVYEEVMPEPRASILALPSADGRTETLLLGGEDWLWQYEAAGTVDRTAGPKGKHSA